MTPTKLYLITCGTTGKSYAGVTSASEDIRWRRHVRDSRNPKTKLAAAIEQYGASDFTRTVLHEYPSWESACEAEKDVIAGLNLVAGGYNTALGGDGGATRTGQTHTAATRAKMSAAAAGRPKSAEQRANMSTARKGIPNHLHSEATKAQMSRSALAIWAARQYANAAMPLTAVGVCHVDTGDLLYA